MNIKRIGVLPWLETISLAQEAVPFVTLTADTVSLVYVHESAMGGHGTKMR